MSRWVRAVWLLLLLNESIHFAESLSSSIQYINHQRCLLVECREPQLPPVVILPGMAQSIAVYESHVPAFARDRHVLVYEAMGIGPENQGWLDDVSLPAQAERLEEALQSLWGEDAVNVVGFSLGGRIAMALGCQYPKRIQQMHLTGVALERSDWGQLQLMGWLDHLQHANLRSFAWSAILATYSPEFLIQQKEKMPLWVERICEAHSVEGLRSLLEQAHDQDPAWSVASMAQRLKVPGHLCTGENDMLAHNAKALAEALGWDKPTIIPAAGHAVPMEAGRLWREDIKKILG